MNQSLKNRYSGMSESELVEEILSQHVPSRNPIVRGIWITIGSLGVVLAGVGVLLTGLPTTSWLVLSAYCYARSSERMFRWLLSNRMFGNVLVEYYKNGKSLPFHSKVVICGIVCIASGASIYLLTQAGDPGYGQALIAILAIIGVWWIGWKTPTTE